MKRIKSQIASNGWEWEVSERVTRRAGQLFGRHRGRRVRSDLGRGWWRGQLWNRQGNPEKDDLARIRIKAIRPRKEWKGRVLAEAANDDWKHNRRGRRLVEELRRNGSLQLHWNARLANPRLSHYAQIYSEGPPSLNGGKEDFGCGPSQESYLAEQEIHAIKAPEQGISIAAIKVRIHFERSL